MTYPGTQHVDHVLQTVHSKSAAAQCRIAASWRRSLVHHKIDPRSKNQPTRITDTELGQAQDRHADLMRAAQAELDALFAMVHMSGCAVLITDATGLVLDRRAASGDAHAFDIWGLRAGVDWSEAREGTNGIGTCLAEARALVIHRTAHFQSKHTGMSCIDAPIFGPDGALVGALDVSSARADQTEVLNALLLSAVTRAAQQIEETLFRAQYPQARLISLQDRNGPMLIAVDRDDLVLGATRAARHSLGLDISAPLALQPVADLLGMTCARRGMAGAEQAALRQSLSRSGGNVSAAAKDLGVSRATFYRRMKRVGLDQETQTCLSPETPSALQH